MEDNHDLILVNAIIDHYEEPLDIIVHTKWSDGFPNYL